jgi:hypothetical protein
VAVSFIGGGNRRKPLTCYILFLFETNDDCTKAVLSISTIDLENFICSSNDFVSALDWFFIFSSAAAIIGRKILNFVYN